MTDAELQELRCFESNCLQQPTHYVQEKGNYFTIKHGEFRMDELRVPYCAEHAPIEAKPISETDEPTIVEVER